MTTPRFYFPPEVLGKETVWVAPAQAHHLTHVLRVKPGAEITCFDGEGNEASGIVSHRMREGLSVEIVRRRKVPPLSWEVTLGVAVPRHGKLDQITDQATQLGVCRVIPLITSRGVVRISSGDWEKRRHRLWKIIIEAGKQCGISYLPTLEKLHRMEELIDSFPRYHRILLAAVEGPYELWSNLLSRGVNKVLILVGPEGDFTPGERKAVLGKGAQPVSLGSAILRCETAVVAALSLANFFLREGISR